MLRFSPVGRHDVGAAGTVISLEHLRTGYVLAEEVERSISASTPAWVTLAA